MQQKKQRKPPGTGYKWRLEKRALAEKAQATELAQSKVPESAKFVTSGLKTLESISNAFRVADNAVFIYYRVGRVEPTILLSREDNEPLLKLPVFHRRPERFDQARIGVFISKIGTKMANRVTHGLGVPQEFKHTFCNFFPSSFSLYEEKTSAWVVGPLNTVDFDEWESHFNRESDGQPKTFKSKWCPISELEPEAIRPMHRKVILFGIGALKQAYQYRFDPEFKALAQKLQSSLPPELA